MHLTFIVDEFQLVIFQPSHIYTTCLSSHRFILVSNSYPFSAWIFNPRTEKCYDFCYKVVFTSASFQKIASGSKLWWGPPYHLLDESKLEDFWRMKFLLFSWSRGSLCWRWAIRSTGTSHIGTIMHSIDLWSGVFYRNFIRDLIKLNDQVTCM